MPNPLTPATDSAAELHKLVGDDATATFENEPTFIDTDATVSASSENLEEQRPGAGLEFQAAASPSGKGAAPDADEEDDLVEDDEDDEEDEFEDDDDEDDVEDDDEDDLDDEEDDDDEDDLDDDEEEDEDEDDADEVKASASPLLADGLLGYEDEADDARKGVDRVTGDGDRERAEARKLTDDRDENPYDAYINGDPAAAHEGEVGSNVVIRPVKPSDLRSSQYGSHAAL